MSLNDNTMINEAPRVGLMVKVWDLGMYFHLGLRFQSLRCQQFMC